MINFQRRRSLFPLTASIASVFVLSATPSSATDDGFFDCTAGLLDKGIATAEATAACGGARFPEELGNCVVDINDVTGIGAAEALSVCERTRRPEEVANCTIDIHDSLLTAPNPTAMEYCGRSVLPERYATCVIDLRDAAELAADEALTSCIRAGYRPWEIAPRL
ncbi:MAG: hypothetical protein AAF921_14835 [Cyanobacteria bacterium P01_D01_bin.44]